MVKTVNLSADLGLNTLKFDQGLNRAGTSLSKFGRQSKTTLGESGRYFNQFTRTAESTSGVLNKVTTSLAILGATATAALSVKEIIRYSDTWKTLEGRLSIVTASSKEMAAVQEDLFRIAQSTRSPLEAVTNLYTRISQSLTEQQRSTTNVIGVTETFSKALAITGESAASAQGAVLQFTQAVAGDFKSAGQELGSVIEQSPRVAKALADGLGVTTAGLKELAKVGKITRQQVFEILDPLSEQGKAIEEEFGRIPTTVSKALTTLDNALLKYVGESELAAQGTGFLATSIQEVANNFEQLANIALAFGGVFTLRAIAPLVDAFKAATVAQVGLVSATLKGNTVLLAADRQKIASAQASLNQARAEVVLTEAIIARNTAMLADVAAGVRVGTSKAQITKATNQLADAQKRLPKLINATATAHQNLAVVTAGALRGVKAFGVGLASALGTPLGLTALIAGLTLLEEKTGLLSSTWDMAAESYKALLQALGAEFSVYDKLSNVFDDQIEKARELAAIMNNRKAANKANPGTFTEESIEELNRQYIQVLSGVQGLGNQLGALDGESEKKKKKSSVAATGGGDEKDPFGDVIKNLEQEAQMLKISADLFDGKASAIKRAQDELRILNDLQRQDVDLQPKQMELLKSKLDAIQKESEALEELEEQKKKAQELEEERKKAIEEYANAFESSFEDAVLSGEKLRDVMQGLLQDILKIAIRSSITRPLGNAVGDAFSSGGGDFFSAFSDLLPSFDVGTNFVPKDMMANIHKGEAIIPADEAEALRNGGGMMGGGEVTVNITNNTGAAVKTSSSKTASGTSLNVLIDQAVADSIARKGSKTNQALSTFNTQSIVRR